MPSPKLVDVLGITANHQLPEGAGLLQVGKTSSMYSRKFAVGSRVKIDLFFPVQHHYMMC